MARRRVSIVVSVGNVADERNHDLRQGVHGLGLQLQRGLDDGLDLHLVDLGIHQPEAATAQAQHGVGLVQLGGTRNLAARQRHVGFRRALPLQAG